MATFALMFFLHFFFLSSNLKSFAAALAKLFRDCMDTGHFFFGQCAANSTSLNGGCARHFSNQCDVCKVAKVVHGNRSDNRCHQSDVQPSI